MTNWKPGRSPLPGSDPGAAGRGCARPLAGAGPAPGGTAAPFGAGAAGAKCQNAGELPMKSEIDGFSP